MTPARTAARLSRNEPLKGSGKASGRPSVASVGNRSPGKIFGEEEQGKRKHNGVFEANHGMCGCTQRVLPGTMTLRVNAGRVSVEDLVRICPTNPAGIFGVYPHKGVLSPGSDTDFFLVDWEIEVVVGDSLYRCRRDSMSVRAGS